MPLCSSSWNGQPPLCLEDFLVGVPGSCHMPADPWQVLDLYSLRFCLPKDGTPVPLSPPPAATTPRIPVLKSGVPLA